MLTFLFITAIIFYLIYLSSRISTLEKKLKEMQSLSEDVLQRQASTDVLDPARLERRKPAASQLQSFTLQKSTDAQHQFFTWLKTDWLLKLGAFLLILAIAWFVTYAFAENWIGPVGRVSLGLAFGSLMLIFAQFWNNRNPLQASIFMVVGAVAILITVYASRTIYDFFTPTIALFMMASVAVFMAFSSVVNKVESRAIISILLAGIVPFLTNADTASVIGLLSYGFIVIAGTLWVVSITGWRRLAAVGLGVYAVYSLLSISRYTTDDVYLLRVLIFAYTLLFYAASLITHLRATKSAITDFIVSLGNAFLMVLWITQMDIESEASLFAILAALLFFIGAFMLYKVQNKSHIVFEYMAVAFALLGFAAAFELDGPALTITYSVLVCAFSFLTHVLTKSSRFAQLAGAMLFLVAVHSWLASAWNSGSSTNEYLISWWILVAEFFGLGAYFYRLGKRQQVTEVITNAAIYLIAGLFLAVLSIWQTFELWFRTADTAHGAALVTYTILGLILYVYARLHAMKKTMYSGAILLGIVVLRLLVVEIWLMDLIQRVIVFSLIGILLMSTAFIKPVKSQ